MISQKSTISLKRLDKLTKKSKLEQKIDILAEAFEVLEQKVNGLLALEKERWKSTIKRMGK